MRRNRLVPQTLFALTLAVGGGTALAQNISKQPAPQPPPIASSDKIPALGRTAPQAPVPQVPVPQAPVPQASQPANPSGPQASTHRLLNLDGRGTAGVSGVLMPTSQGTYRDVSVFLRNTLLLRAEVLVVGADGAYEAQGATSGSARATKVTWRMAGSDVRDFRVNTLTFRMSGREDVRLTVDELSVDQFRPDNVMMDVRLRGLMVNANLPDMAGGADSPAVLRVAEVTLDRLAMGGDLLLGGLARADIAGVSLDFAATSRSPAVRGSVGRLSFLLDESTRAAELNVTEMRAESVVASVPSGNLRVTARLADRRLQVALTATGGPAELAAAGTFTGNLPASLNAPAATWQTSRPLPERLSLGITQRAGTAWPDAKTLAPLPMLLSMAGVSSEVTRAFSDWLARPRGTFAVDGAPNPQGNLRWTVRP